MTRYPRASASAAADQEAELLPAVLFGPANMDLVKKGSKGLIKSAEDMSGVLSLYQGLCTDLTETPAPQQTNQTDSAVMDGLSQLLQRSASFRAIFTSKQKVLCSPR